MQPILRCDDYQFLSQYLDGRIYASHVDRSNAQKLRSELKRARVVSPLEFPGDVIRLNSRVSVRNEERNDVMELVLVTPDKVNQKQNLISVMAPISIALLGFRQGQRITWKMPTGLRTYTILQVDNVSE